MTSILVTLGATNCVARMMSGQDDSHAEATNFQEATASKTLPLMMLAIGFVLMLGSVVLAGACSGR